MPPKVSAGLLMHRSSPRGLEVFLVHQGGPFFKNKDLGVWSIPKGQVNPSESLLSAAQREFQEETGLVLKGPFVFLNHVRMRSGKIVHAWAFQASPEQKIFVKSNLFDLEWPPKSGKIQKFPEVDRAQFFPIKEAKKKILPAQQEFLTTLSKLISIRQKVRVKKNSKI